MANINIISAIALNGAIGKNGKLLFPNQKADMLHFKDITMNHTVVMGRKTFESLGNKPLNNRRNIVLSNTLPLTEGIEVYKTKEELLNNLNDDEEVFIIGGEQIYNLFINDANVMYITTIFGDGRGADTFFPEIDRYKWHIISSKIYTPDASNSYPYMFQKYIKKHKK